MRKFIWKNSKSKTFIYECEVSIFRPKPFNLKDDEEKYVIEKPESLKEDLPFSFSFFFFDTKESCIEDYRRAIRESFETIKLTRGIDYLDKDVEDKVTAVEYKTL